MWLSTLVLFLGYTSIPCKMLDCWCRMWVTFAYFFCFSNNVFCESVRFWVWLSFEYYKPLNSEYFDGSFFQVPTAECWCSFHVIVYFICIFPTFFRLRGFLDCNEVSFIFSCFRFPLTCIEILIHLIFGNRRQLFCYLLSVAGGITQFDIMRSIKII